MHTNRRKFIQHTALGLCALGFAPRAGWAGTSEGKLDSGRFQLGIQEYTFHRWLGERLDHLDYPALVKRELGIDHIEYWSRAFNGRQSDPAYVGELANRTTGEGMTNVLILVDENDELDDPDATVRARSLEAHKAWVDCAHRLGCDAIRVNCRSGGDRQQNLANAVESVGRLCGYAEGSGVKIVIEPHGGNSDDPDWLVEAMQALNHPLAGLLPDFNNFGEYDRYEGVAKSLPWAPAICAKALAFDAEGRETQTDYFRMLKLIHDSDYFGVITIEYEGPLDPIEGARMTKDLILRALEAASV